MRLRFWGVGRDREDKLAKIIVTGFWLGMGGREFGV